MDIRVAISSAGIFMAVYAVTLGIPFFLLGKGHALAAVMVSISLASVAPFIYARLKRQAEDKILIEEKTYQHVLLQASRGLNRWKTVEEITSSITEIFFKAVRITNVAFYAHDGKAFVRTDVLGDARGYPPEIPKSARIVSWITGVGGAVAVDDLKAHGASGIEDPEGWTRTFRSYGACVIVPICHEERVLGLLFLGEKQSHVPYSDRDLSVLNVIADQMALAIENCQYLKAETERIKEEGAKVRREYLDTMVACMAHEIDNPMTVIIGQSDMLEEIMDFSAKDIPPGFRKDLSSSLGHMREAALRVSRIIKKIEEFAKGGAGKAEPTNVYDVLDGYHVIKDLSKKKKIDVEYKEEIETGLPIVMAEKIMMEEVLINFMENAYHAVGHNDGPKQVFLKISRNGDNAVRVLFEDNGYGMKPETLSRVFQVPTTTKGSVEGTGLGLYRVRQICDVLGASYGVHSDGPGRGTRVWVDVKI